MIGAAGGVVSVATGRISMPEILAFSTWRMNWIERVPSVTVVVNSRTMALLMPAACTQMSKLVSSLAPPSMLTSKTRSPAPFLLSSAKWSRTW